MDDFFGFIFPSDDARGPWDDFDRSFGCVDADEPAVVIESRYALESGGAAVAERDLREAVAKLRFGVEDAPAERPVTYLPAQFGAPRIGFLR